MLVPLKNYNFHFWNNATFKNSSPEITQANKSDFIVSQGSMGC